MTSDAKGTAPPKPEDAPETMDDAKSEAQDAGSERNETGATQTDWRRTARPLPPQRRNIPWGVVLAMVLIVLIAAVVLLTALPLGAVWIVSNSGCCVFDGMENVATFWGSLTAGFLALFGFLIAGVYVITAFRTDVTARAEARDAVATYIERTKADFYKDLDEFQCAVRRGIARVKRKTNDSINKIQADRKAVATAAKDAGNSIDSKLKDVERKRVDAVRKINTARDEVETAAKAARAAAEAATEAAGDAAQAAVEARDAVETAAEAAIERINEAISRLPPPPRSGGG